MKLKVSTTILLLVCIAYAVYSASRKELFTPAADFPPGALVYAEVSDLPAFVKLWNESKLKDKYLGSKNFDELKNRHLGLKLASRWQEFSDAAGFSFDLEAISGLSETRAAVAVYDVGKLEFVFVAPVSDEVFAATKFAQNKDEFEEETLADGTIVYTKDVEADRGRQKQKLAFANVKGRFVLATSEKLLAQTVANINGKTNKNSLSDEPDFKILRERVEPHLATVWVNQIALNDDYYFRHYWLMPNLDELKNIRAGIFDFAKEDGKFVERRKFLLAHAKNPSQIKSADADQLENLLPENIPFYQVRAANSKLSADTIFDTIFDGKTDAAKTEQKNRSRFSGYEFDDYEGRNYNSLSEKFDETIDDAEEVETIGENAKPNETARTNLQNALQAAAAQSVLTATRPQNLPMPLFVEFRRAAIFGFGSPEKFNREEFETSIAQNVAGKFTASASNAKLDWETKSENEFSWRELKLPMLGWEIGYAMRDNKLIVSNNIEFLREIIATRNEKAAEKSESPFTELTILDFNQRVEAYDKVFFVLSDKKAPEDFFNGNIKSLLDSISDVKKVEIKRNYASNFLDEEITVNF